MGIAVPHELEHTNSRWDTPAQFDLVYGPLPVDLLYGPLPVDLVSERGAAYFRQTKT